MGLGKTVFRIRQRIKHEYYPKAKRTATDWYEDTFKYRHPDVPPKRLDFIGGGPYLEIGQEFFQYFMEAGLKPHHKVLDIGSGLGRMARPLVGYLDPDSEYHGVDIVANQTLRNITGSRILAVISYKSRS